MLRAEALDQVLNKHCASLHLFAPSSLSLISSQRAHHTPLQMSHNPPQDRRRGKGPIGGIIKLIGTGVGAAVEYHGHRKERKATHAAAAQSEQTEEPVVAGPSSQPLAAQRSISENEPPSYSESTKASDRQLATGPVAQDDKKPASRRSSFDSSSDSDSDDLIRLEEDEEAWELDELAASTEPPSYEDATGEDDDALVRDVLQAHGSSTTPKAAGKLELPVVIPQRRPRNKTRGFVRAYSPALEDVGIDQETFLRFLKNFHKSSQANPVFNAVMVAAGIVGFVPEPTIVRILPHFLTSNIVPR